MRVTRILAATAAAAALTVSATAPAFAAADPKANNPASWEDGGRYDCSKVEFGGDTRTYTVPAGTGFVVIKAGTENYVYPMGWSAYDVAVPKGISHVITCVGGYQYPPS